MYWMNGFLLSCLITIVRSASIRSEIDRKRYICGTEIAKQLSKHCKTYTGSEDNHYSGYHEEDRGSGQVVGLCCERGCSVRELLDNFCKVIKPESKALFDREQELTNAIIANKNNEETKESQEIAITPKTEVTKRPSRRNNRKINRHVRRIINTKSQSSSSPSKPKNGKSKQRRCRCCKQLRKVPNQRILQAQQMLLHKLTSD